MATNRPDTLDPALLRPGRLDRKVEFGLPDLEGRGNIFKIHARSMSVERDLRYELIDLDRAVEGAESTRHVTILAALERRFWDDSVLQLNAAERHERQRHQSHSNKRNT